MDKLSRDIDKIQAALSESNQPQKRIRLSSIDAEVFSVRWFESCDFAEALCSLPGVSERIPLRGDRRGEADKAAYAARFADFVVRALVVIQKTPSLA